MTPQHPNPLRRVVRYLEVDDRLRRIAAGIGLVLVVLFSLTFAPLMRSIATSQAAARGLALDADRVWPGWMSVHLADVRLGLEGTSVLDAHFDHIEVSVTPWLSLRGVVVERGDVKFSGTEDQLREQLEAWRARRRSGSEGSTRSGSGQGLSIEASDIDVSWRDGDEDATLQSIQGISFERKGDRGRAAFESAELATHGAALRLGAAKAEFAAGPDGLALETASLEQLLGRVSVAVSKEAPDPNAAAAPSGGAASDLDEEEWAAADVDARDTPDPKDAAASKAAGRSAQQTIADRLAPLAAESWPRRRAQLETLRRLLRARIAESARFDVAKVQLEVTHGQSVLNVGPAPLTFERREGLVSASFLPRADNGGKQLTLHARLPLEAGPVELELDGGPISLALLGVREGDFGLLGVKHSELTLSTHVELSPEGALDVAASGRLERLSLDQPSLATEPLRDMNLNWGGHVRLDLGQRRFAIEDGSLGIENARITLAGAIEASESDVRVGLNVDVPKTSCQELLSAAPAALLPQLQGLRLGGSFGLHLRVALDTSDLAKTEVDWELDNRCKVLETPEEIDPKRFHEPFQHYVVEPDGRATEFTTGPTTELWVPLNEITPALETGLIVCEDSRFFKHDGFDNKAIRDSILLNLKKGSFARGASTLSMQLAKNLYLGREKTMSRKLQQAAFTMLLEERLSKEDILELYLNVVEFGPGIYGIRNAAKHYFNSHPGELSLAQAMFLASILPNPKANHFQADGALKPSWDKHLKYLMRVARKINRISDDELEAGMNEHLVFGQAHADTASDFLFGTPIYNADDN